MEPALYHHVALSAVSTLYDLRAPTPAASTTLPRSPAWNGPGQRGAVRMSATHIHKAHRHSTQSTAPCALPCQAQPHHIQRTDLERAVAVIRVVDPGDRQHYVGPDLDPVFRCCNVTCNLTARPRVMTDAPQKGGKKRKKEKKGQGRETAVRVNA